MAGPDVGLVVGAGLRGQGQRHRVGIVLDRDRWRDLGSVATVRQRPQPVEELREGGPVARLRVESRRHDLVQVVGQAGEVELAAPDPVHDRHRGAAAERRVPGAGVRHRRRPGVHVGGGGRVLAVQDLGRQVARRAEQPAGVGELRVVGDPRQAEVDEDRGASLHQHVGRLHVAVQHSDRVHRRDPLRQPGGEPVEVGAGDGPLLDDQVVQGEAGHVAGGDVRDRRPRVGVDDARHPAAADPLERADLACQPVSGLVVADDVRPEDLERDPVTVTATGQVDDAHPALAELGEQGVPADGGALSGPGAGGVSRHGPRLPVPKPAAREDHTPFNLHREVTTKVSLTSPSPTPGLP